MHLSFLYGFLHIREHALSNPRTPFSSNPLSLPLTLPPSSPSRPQLRVTPRPFSSPTSDCFALKRSSQYLSILLVVDQHLARCFVISLPTNCLSLAPCRQPPHILSRSVDTQTPGNAGSEALVTACSYPHEPHCYLLANTVSRDSSRTADRLYAQHNHSRDSPHRKADWSPFAILPFIAPFLIEK